MPSVQHTGDPGPPPQLGVSLLCTSNSVLSLRKTKSSLQGPACLACGSCLHGRAQLRLQACEHRKPVQLGSIQTGYLELVVHGLSQVKWQVSMGSSATHLLHRTGRSQSCSARSYQSTALRKTGGGCQGCTLACGRMRGHLQLNTPLTHCRDIRRRTSLTPLCNTCMTLINKHKSNDYHNAAQRLSLRRAVLSQPALHAPSYWARAEKARSSASQYAAVTGLKKSG